MINEIIGITDGAALLSRFENEAKAILQYPSEKIQPTRNGCRAVPLFNEPQACEPSLDLQLLNGFDALLIADFLDHAYPAEVFVAVEDWENAHLGLAPGALDQGVGGAVLWREGERYLTHAASCDLPIGQDQLLVHGNPGFDVVAVRGQDCVTRIASIIAEGHGIQSRTISSLEANRCGGFIGAGNDILLALQKRSATANYQRTGQQDTAAGLLIEVHPSLPDFHWVP